MTKCNKDFIHIHQCIHRQHLQLWDDSRLRLLCIDQKTSTVSYSCQPCKCGSSSNLMMSDVRSEEHWLCWFSPTRLCSDKKEGFRDTKEQNMREKYNEVHLCSTMRSTTKEMSMTPKIQEDDVLSQQYRPSLHAILLLNTKKIALMRNVKWDSICSEQHWSSLFQECQRVQRVRMQFVREEKVTQNMNNCRKTSVQRCFSLWEKQLLLVRWSEVRV